MGHGISGQWRRRHLLIEHPLACAYDSVWDNIALRTLREGMLVLKGKESRCRRAREGVSPRAGRNREGRGVRSRINGPLWRRETIIRRAIRRRAPGSVSRCERWPKPSGSEPRGPSWQLRMRREAPLIHRPCPPSSSSLCPSASSCPTFPASPAVCEPARSTRGLPILTTHGHRHPCRRHDSPRWHPRRCVSRPLCNDHVCALLRVQIGSSSHCPSLYGITSLQAYLYYRDQIKDSYILRYSVSPSLRKIAIARKTDATRACRF